MRPLLRPVLVSALVLGALIAPAVQASAVSVPSWTTVGSASAHVAGQHVVGSASGSSAIDLRVTLTPSNASGLAAMALAVVNPASPHYHHYFSPAQIRRAYAPSASEVRSVASYFRSQGLVVDPAISDGFVLHVHGTVSQAARAFHTTFDQVRSAHGVVGVANATAAQLPRSVSSFVQGIVGLNSAARAFPQSVRASDAVTPPTSCSAADTAESKRTGLAPTPADQASVYGLDAQYAAGYSGTGRNVGLLEFAGYNQPDVNFYFSCYGLSTTVTSVNVDGGPASGTLTDGSSIESDLDIEEAAVLAPGANIVNYQSANTLNAFIDVFATVAQEDRVSSLSVSWGICETQTTSTAYQPVLEQLAAEGIPVLVAAGDSGSEQCANNALPGGHADYSLEVDDPANSPWVTAIGGLRLNSFTPGDASVWNDLCSGGVPCGGGGGVSTVYDRPSWQTGVGVNTSLAGRELPDISVMGDPRTGFMVYYNGHFGSVGGTSIGAPIVAAMVTVDAQACGVSGVGFLDPRLYQMASDGVGILDITSGSNDLYGTGGYSATTGYDMASGLGTPDNATFLPALCGAVGSSSATPTTAGVTSNWSFSVPTGTHTITAGTALTVTLLGSKAILPASTNAYTVNGTSVVASVTNGVVTLAAPHDIAPNSTITIGVTGAVNAPSAGATIVEVSDPTGYLQVAQIPTTAPAITHITNNAPSKIFLGGETSITVTALDGNLPVYGQSVLATSNSSNLVIIGSPLNTNVNGQTVLTVAGTGIGSSDVSVGVGSSTFDLHLTVANTSGATSAKYVVAKGDVVSTTARPSASTNCGVVAQTKKGHLADTVKTLASALSAISGVGTNATAADGPAGSCVVAYVTTTGSLKLAVTSGGAKATILALTPPSGVSVAKVTPGLSVSGTTASVVWASSTGHLELSTVSPITTSASITTADITTDAEASNVSLTGLSLGTSIAQSGSTTDVSVVSNKTVWVYSGSADAWTKTDLSLNAGYTNTGKAALTGSAAIVSTNTAGDAHDFLIATRAVNGHVVVFNPSPDDAGFWFVDDVTSNTPSLTTTADVSLFDAGVPTAIVIGKSGVDVVTLPSPFPAPWIIVPVKVTGAKATFASASSGFIETATAADQLHL